MKHRIRRSCLVAGFLIPIALGSQSSVAQYIANFQTNVISAVTSNWSGTYYVGNTNFADSLIVLGGGILSDNSAYLGYGVGSSNNTVLVTDPGSVWSNGWDGLTVGYYGPGNSVVVSNGGQVISGEVYLGCDGNSSSNNSIVVTGCGSILTSDPSFVFAGCIAPGNRIVVSDGGQFAVPYGFSYIGYYQDLGWSSNNSVLVTGPGSRWAGETRLTVGGQNNDLVVSNGAWMTTDSGTIGDIDVTMTVAGTGSVWSNSGDILIGRAWGSNTCLMVKDGGEVMNSDTIVGWGGPYAGGPTFCNDNSVLVTGTGSVWSSTGTLTIGFGDNGVGNSLIISNGGVVIDDSSTIGFCAGCSDNYALVTGVGSVWSNLSSLVIDMYAEASSVVVSGGTLFATNVVIGAVSPPCNNMLRLDSGEVSIRNAAGNAALEIRYGELILNGGVLQADTLVITNPCASLIHTGGTMIVGSVILDPNTFRIVSVTPTGNDVLVTWRMGPGATNTLQATAGDGSGGYGTNGFTDIFVVTNNTTVGTVTNYLDIGAATNMPTRYYRARLVP